MLARFYNWATPIGRFLGHIPQTFLSMYLNVFCMSPLYPPQQLRSDNSFHIRTPFYLKKLVLGLLSLLTFIKIMANVLPGFHFHALYPLIPLISRKLLISVWNDFYGSLNHLGLRITKKPLSEEISCHFSPEYKLRVLILTSGSRLISQGNPLWKPTPSSPLRTSF